jgi:hypothetical protein
MKKLNILFVSLIFSLILNGQSNLDFESWNFGQQGIENPEHWSSNNVPNYISVNKLSNAYSGNYCASI